MDNLFANLPRASGNQEEFCELLKRPGLRIERIVSTGQCSPPDFWYDQDEHEWILLIQGAAGLRFEDERETRILHAGDFLEIQPHRRHRVEWTASDQCTIWLAIFHSA